MKNTVTITLDDKKVQALKMYLSEKHSSLDEEISKYAEQLSSRFGAAFAGFAKRLCVWHEGGLGV